MKNLAKYPEFLVTVLCLLLYAPFLGEAVLRTTGDEKVYVAQAFEMTQRSSWFLQTLADVPNYFKGPLHYILIRIGYEIFGPHSLWSALWMNLASLSLAAFALTRGLKLYWRDTEWAFLVGLGLIFSPGVFAHTFASQMEVELTALYTGVLAILVSMQAKEQASLGKWMSLWLLIGLASWLKSPIHSVLLGSGVLVYSMSHEEWRRGYLQQLHYYLAPFAGIILGALAFGIPWFLDPEAFYHTYIQRETFGKGPNGVTVAESFWPNISYSIWPLAPILATALVLSVYHRFRHRSKNTWHALPGIDLALVISLPTFAFFGWHPYRSEIYSLPAIPGILMLTACLGKAMQVHYPLWWKRALSFSLVTSFLSPLLIIALHFRFQNTAPWWPRELTILAIFCLFLQIAALYFHLAYSRRHIASGLVLSFWWPAFFLIAFFMSVIGHEDLRELKMHSKNARPHEVYGFYNAQQSIWNEWGMLNLSSGLTVRGLHSELAINNWLLAGKPLIVSNQKELKHVSELFPSTQFKIKTWSRWSSHGDHSPVRNPRLAWQKRDLEILRQNAYIVQIEAKAI